MAINNGIEKLKTFLWIILYRRIKRYCENPKSNLYEYYGALGIKCKFTSAREIKYLFLRDKANEMDEPHFSRKNENGNYSKRNCFFEESKEWIDRACKRASAIPYEKFE